MQSKQLRAWTLGFTASHGSQVVSPEYDKDVYMATFLEVGLGDCVESQVTIHSRSIRAISAVESIEVGVCYFTWVPRC